MNGKHELNIINTAHDSQKLAHLFLVNAFQYSIFSTFWNRNFSPILKFQL